jgi:hypothetical protein
MRLRKHDRPWAPLDQPDYLCILRPGYQSPRNREVFLMEQADLLRRLVAQANQGEIKDANRRLKDNLPWEFLTCLPDGLFDDPKTLHSLMFNPASEGGNLHDWKTGVDDLLTIPSMPDREAWDLAVELCLEVYLGRIL